MATKSTHKKNKFNKNELANRLEKLAEKVSSKDIYVVGKDHNGFYAVVDYKSSKIVYQDIPTRGIASKMCSKLNQRPYTVEKVKEIYQHINTYHKHFTDSVFYHQTLTCTEEPLTYYSTLDRINVANARMRYTVSKLLGMC